MNNNIAKITQSWNENETFILLYPQNKPKKIIDLQSIKTHIKKNILAHSFKGNERIGFVTLKAPVLCGFYEAYSIHYPIRIKPDDIWLLIVQAFSNHININSESLRKMFVNFDGKNFKYRIL